MKQTIKQWLSDLSLCANMSATVVDKRNLVDAICDIIELDKYSIELQEAVNDQVNLVIKQNEQISILKNSLEHAAQRVMEVSFKLLDRDKEIESLKAENARLSKSTTPKNSHLYVVFVNCKLPGLEYFAADITELSQYVNSDHPGAKWSAIRLEQ